MARITHRFVKPRMLLAALFLVLGIGAAAPASSLGAQDGPSVTTFTITVLTCLEPGCTEFIEDTAPTEGVSVEVSTLEGGSLGSCTTDTTGACSLDIEWFPTVTLTFDEGTIPEGYDLTGNPVEWPLGEEPQDAASASVLLFPVDGFPEEPEPTVTPTEAPDDPGSSATEPPVSQLPSTGTGTNAGAGTVVLNGVLVVAVALGLVALASREVAARKC